MFFKRVITKSLAQYSYIIGQGKDMVVIDPQANIDMYLDISRQEGMKITAILETHRNEDFKVGSRALSEVTGAKVYIAADDKHQYKYGTRIKDNNEISIGNVKLKAIHTPGHTLGSMSYVLYLKNDNPYMVFSGDTLFFGGVGRTDFYGEDRLEEITGYLYESIFNKLLPLGDHVILCPAHGAGSACGASIEDRPYSTLGYERKFNPDLQYKTKEEFIKNVGKILPKPQYFEVMEEINLAGTEPIGYPIDLKIKYTDEIEKSSSKLVDIRNQKAFLAEHIKDSLYVEASAISSYLNWFVGTDESLIFITDKQDKDYLNKLYIDMRRIGYDEKLSFLAGALDDWNKQARDVEQSDYSLPSDIRNEVSELTILDIREESEFEDIKPLKGSILIPMEEIKDRYNEIPKDKTICVVCASGIRSTTVASFLEQKNIKTSILLGGIEAWNNLY